MRVMTPSLLYASFERYDDKAEHVCIFRMRDRYDLAPPLCERVFPYTVRYLKSLAITIPVLMNMEIF